MDLTNKGSFLKPSFEPYKMANGDTAFIRVMSVKETDDWHAIIRSEQAKTEVTPIETIYVSHLVRTLCDDTGQRIFGDSDTAKLSEAPATIIAELYYASMKINVLTQEARDELKKNSP